jgi:lactoylglutathione lyase
MKFLHTAIRVSDVERSRRFYAAFGFTELGAVEIPGGYIVVLNLPGDGEAATLELFYDAKSKNLVAGDGLSHLVVQVDDIKATNARLQQNGLAPGEVLTPGGPSGPKTCYLFDPDGHRFELVEWPPGHSVAMTRADFQR